MNKMSITDGSEQEDVDPIETKEWIDALQSVIEREGHDRAHYLVEQLLAAARKTGSDIPFSANTEYLNTIAVEQQPQFPGDTTIEQKVRSYIRWNAMMMVLRANRDTNVGGHIASFASAATLYDVGQNHFWHGATEDKPGDLIFSQGHSAPGMYSRGIFTRPING